MDKMYPGLVLITIIQATLAPSQPSKPWKVLNAVVEDGLYGWNLTIRRGKNILYDFPAVFSPHNAFCYDNETRVFLHSNNSLYIITKATDKMFYLEYNGKSVKLNDSGNFDSQNEASNSFDSMVNLTSSKAGEDLPDSIEDSLLPLKIVLPPIIITLAVAAAVAAFLWKKWRCPVRTSTDPPQPDLPESQPMNSKDTYTAQKTSNTQNHTHVTHSNGVSSGQYISMVSMDSSEHPTLNAIC